MLRLDKIITSSLRLNLLRYFLAENTRAKASIRHIAREMKYVPSQVKKELELLEAAGILESEKMGNQKLYSVKYSGPFAEVFRKEPHVLMERVKEVTGVEIAYVHSASREEFKMIVIGAPDSYFMNRVVRAIEEEGSFRLTYTVMKKEDITRKQVPDPLFFVAGNKEMFEQAKAFAGKDVSQGPEHDKLSAYKKRKWER